MGQARFDSRQSGNAAQRGGNDRRDAEHFFNSRRRRVGRDIGPSDFLERLDAAARRIEQPNQWQSVIACHLVDQILFAFDGRFNADGKVAGVEGHFPSVDFAQTDDRRARRDMSDFVALVGSDAGQFADLVKGTFVKEVVDTLANSQFSAAPLFGDARFTSQRRSKRLSLLQLLEFRVPKPFSTLSDISKSVLSRSSLVVAGCHTGVERSSQ